MIEAGELKDAALIEVSEAVERAHKFIKANQQAMAKFRKACKEAFAFYAGKQWDKASEMKLNEEDRPTAVFNFTRKFIDIVVGTQKHNQQEIIFMPRVPDKQMMNAMSELASRVFDVEMAQCDGYDEQGDAFKAMLIAGVGWTNTRIDTDSDPDGRLVVEKVDAMRMWWDASARKKNLMDSREVGYEFEIPLAEAIARWPHKESQLRLLERTKDAPAGASTSPDEVEHVTPIEYDPINETPGASLMGSSPSPKGFVRVLEHQFYELRSFYKVVDPATGKIEELEEDRFKKLKSRLQPLGYEFIEPDEVRPAAAPETVVYLKQRHRVYRHSFIAGEIELETKDLPVQLADGYGFTYRAMTGWFDSEDRVYRGLLYPLMDPQRYHNKLYSQVLHIINTNPKGSIIMEAGAVADPVKFEQDYSAAGRVLIAEDGALSGDKSKIIPLPAAPMPQAAFTLMQFSMENIGNVGGFSPEMMGQANQDLPATLQRQRVMQGMMIHADYFSALSRYMRGNARLVFEFVREYLADGRLVRIGDPFDSQAIELLRAELPRTMDCDLQIDEPVKSPAAKEAFWEKMAPILPTLIKRNAFIPEILDFAPMPVSLVARIQKRLNDMEQAAAQNPQLPKGQKHPAQVQADIQRTQAQTQLTAARARAIERESGLQGAELALTAARDQREAEGDAEQRRLESMKTVQQILHNHRRARHEQLKETMQLMQPNVGYPQGGMNAIGNPL